ncbi:heavy-metal-associated domain-containing protein [Lentibacillus juripiscarius]|uniref:Heavy-metal-associated domain-containing protein n=1 Tax=Lentibacillus juripiscarius TaxID=257446 RepID=A0ABW5V1F0_9BACI
MAEITIYANEATSGEPIQQIEQALHQLDGIERVLADTDDGELKIEFDEEKISGKRIVGTLQEYDIHDGIEERALSTGFRT